MSMSYSSEIHNAPYFDLTQQEDCNSSVSSSTGEVDSSNHGTYARNGVDYFPHETNGMASMVGNGSVSAGRSRMFQQQLNSSQDEMFLSPKSDGMPRQPTESRYDSSHQYFEHNGRGDSQSIDSSDYLRLQQNGMSVDAYGPSFRQMASDGRGIGSDIHGDHPDTGHTRQQYPINDLYPPNSFPPNPYPSSIGMSTLYAGSKQSDASFDYSAYRRGLMRNAPEGSRGSDPEEYSRRFHSFDFQESGGSDRNDNGFQNREPPGFSAGLSRYAGPGDDWMKDKPAKTTGRNENGRAYSVDYDVDANYDSSSTSWKFHSRQANVPVHAQQHHIQQVHPRSSSSYNTSFSGNTFLGGNEQYHVQQQQVLSRYMGGGRGDEHANISRYVPRQGQGQNFSQPYPGRGGRGNDVTGGGRQGNYQPGTHFQSGKYFDRRQEPYGYGYNPGKVRNDRPFHSDDPSFGGFVNNSSGSGKSWVGSNPNTAGRVAMKSSSRSGDILRDVELEEVIYRNTQIILSETANKRLKSVELANALRDRIGKDYLARTKTLYGGLLVLLELHRETFRVQRVPKNDMVELLIPYRGGDASSGSLAPISRQGSGSSSSSSGGAPQLVPEALGLDSADVEKQQHSRQLPGWDSKPSLSDPSSALTPESSSESTPSLIQPIQPSTCLYIRELPDDATAAQIFADFGGGSIVEKVQINLEGAKRTGLIWFLTVSGALRALSIPLSSWRPFLSFHYPSDAHSFELLEEADAESVAKLCEAMASVSLSRGPQSDRSSSSTHPSSGGGTPNSGIASPSFRNMTSPYRKTSSSTGALDVDMFNVFRESSSSQQLVSPQDDANHLMWGSGKMKISGIPSEKPPSRPDTAGRSSEEEHELGSAPDSKPSLQSSLSERRPAPPPINTALSGEEILLSSRSPSSALSFQLTTSPNAAALSSPGTSEAFFAFQDESAPGGISILSKDNLPTSMIEVMNTLCDVVYVPQKIWERSEEGDYPFVQVIVDILSVIFQNAFVQLTKLKQQVKKRLGGSIRIGPLKALLQAYPEYFEMDKNMTLVRSLKKELPLMNIARVNLRK